MMKVYQIKIPVNSNYAMLRSDPDKGGWDSDSIDVWWDDWIAKGNEIKDFIACIGSIICLENVATELCERFRGLSLFDINIIRTEKDISAKRKLKYLPDYDPIVKGIRTTIGLKLLPYSTVTFEEIGGIKYIHKVEGIAELRGNLLIEREEGKGFFFSKSDLSGYDFFKPENSNYLFCTEEVKKFCEEQNYSNVAFLDVGDAV